jgi:hypothetical protein
MLLFINSQGHLCSCSCSSDLSHLFKVDLCLTQSFTTVQEQSYCATYHGGLDLRSLSCTFFTSNQIQQKSFIMFLKLLQAILLSNMACAYALPALPFSTVSSRQAGTSAASMLLTIAPTSGSCSGAPFPDECATNVEAAPHLITAMSTYGITSPPEIAAVLSLIAYETGDFKYNINHYPAPGRPGQGTRNMQMANYNFLYAKSIPALASQLGAITTSSSTSGLSDDQLNAIRALVLPDMYSWASAAWFLASQCTASTRAAMQAGGQSGYTAYLSCVGTSPTSDRLAYWTRANTALGIS